MKTEKFLTSLTSMWAVLFVQGSWHHFQGNWAAVLVLTFFVAIAWIIRHIDECYED